MWPFSKARHPPKPPEWREIIETVIRNRACKTGVTTANDPAWIDCMSAEAERRASLSRLHAVTYLEREILAYEKQYGSLHLAQ